MDIVKQRAIRSTLALANLAEVATHVIAEISGNDFANSLHNETLTKEALKALVITEARKLIRDKL